MGLDEGTKCPLVRPPIRSPAGGGIAAIASASGRGEPREVGGGEGGVASRLWSALAERFWKEPERIGPAQVERLLSFASGPSPLSCSYIEVY